MLTLYPEFEVNAPRAVDLLELYGTDRIWMNSACDWGVSDPLSVPKAGLEMKRRGLDAATVDKVVYQNPARFLGQSPRFKL